MKLYTLIKTHLRSFSIYFYFMSVTVLFWDIHRSFKIINIFHVMSEAYFPCKQKRNLHVDNEFTRSETNVKKEVLSRGAPKSHWLFISFTLYSDVKWWSIKLSVMLFVRKVMTRYTVFFTSKKYLQWPNFIKQTYCHIYFFKCFFTQLPFPVYLHQRKSFMKMHQKKYLFHLTLNHFNI